jgi:predicted acylesterase/phospholipase RssA
MGLFDFHKATAAIQEGYEATRRQLDDIARNVDLLSA